MKISEDRISFFTANFVGRVVDYSLRPFDWGKADKATQQFFCGDGFKEKFSEIVKIVGEAGFKTIEIWTAHLNYNWATSKQVQDAKQILRDHGLSVCSYAGGFGKSEEELEKCFELVRSMGINVLAGNLSEKLLGRAYSLCQEHRISLAFENHPGRESQRRLKKKRLE